MVRFISPSGAECRPLAAFSRFCIPHHFFGVAAEVFSFNAASSQSEIRPSTKLILAGFVAGDSVATGDALWDDVIGCGAVDGAVG